MYCIADLRTLILYAGIAAVRSEHYEVMPIFAAGTCKKEGSRVRQNYSMLVVECARLIDFHASGICIVSDLYRSKLGGKV